MTRLVLHFGEAMLVDGWATGVRMTIDTGTIAQIETGVPPQLGNERHAFAVPGMPNLHSHAFQRGMAGLAELRSAGEESFWTWRDTMYRFVHRMDPDALHAVAALAYVEMLESGFTRVGEFHYLHHDIGGTRFGDPAEMSRAIFAAAAETGIALTHLPVFYAHGGFGGVAPGDGQERFVHDLDQYADLLERLSAMAAELPDSVVGVAPHSLRAVAPEELLEVVALAGSRPIHIHIAEQLREVEDCVAWSGRRPVQWLLDHASVDARWCLVHATHLTDGERTAFATTGAVAGLCPITEANLGDGLFDAVAWRELGGAFGIGSDSNVLIDAAEELRLLEYGARLTRQRRTLLAAPGDNVGGSLYREAVAGGARALGSASGIAVGMPADIVSLNAAHPSLAGRSGGALLDALVFAARGSAIDTVWRRGVPVVSHGRHHARDQVVARYRVALARLLN